MFFQPALTRKSHPPDLKYPLPQKKWFYHVLWFWIFGDPHFGTVQPSTISNPQLWWHYLNCTLWIHLNLFENILFIWLWFLLTLYPILCILGGKKHQFSVCPARFYVLHDRWIHSLMLFHQTVEGRVSSRCRSGVAGRVLSEHHDVIMGLTGLRVLDKFDNPVRSAFETFLELAGPGHSAVSSHSKKIPSWKLRCSPKQNA